MLAAGQRQKAAAKINEALAIWRNDDANYQPYVEALTFFKQAFGGRRSGKARERP